jgi:hypothetical protein
MQFRKSSHGKFDSLENMRGHEQLRFSTPYMGLSHMRNICIEVSLNKPTSMTNFNNVTNNSNKEKKIQQSYIPVMSLC